MLNLQGTGSAGATVRIYIEQFEPDVSKHDLDAQVALKPLIGLFIILLLIMMCYLDFICNLIYVVGLVRSGTKCLKAKGVHWTGKTNSNYMIIYDFHHTSRIRSGIVAGGLPLSHTLLFYTIIPFVDRSLENRESRLWIMAISHVHCKSFFLI